MSSKITLPINAITSSTNDTIGATPIEQLSMPQMELKKEFTHPANKNPSEWRIEAVGDEDQIIAFNNRSLDIFKGSLEEFNKILRG